MGELTKIIVVFSQIKLDLLPVVHVNRAIHTELELGNGRLSSEAHRHIAKRRGADYRGYIAEIPKVFAGPTHVGQSRSRKHRDAFYMVRRRHDGSGMLVAVCLERDAPDIWESWCKEAGTQAREDRRPLVWKDVSLPAGSEVRMYYGDRHHYATVQRGHIVDDRKDYSPSEWASKVAGGTSRNAWRDLWFREPLSKTWVPATLLRDQARQELLGRSVPPTSDAIGE